MTLVNKVTVGTVAFSTACLHNDSDTMTLINKVTVGTVAFSAACLHNDSH